MDVSRTGYTGDLGFELWVESTHALPLWDALMDVGRDYGLQAAGMLALDVARIEAGLMLIDVDYVPAKKALIESQTSSPYELDLAWAVNLEKAQFVGKEALAAEKARGPAWQFVGIEIGWTPGWSASTPTPGSPPGCRKLPGVPACRSIRAPSRRATPRAAAGRRCSRNTSRSRTCARAWARPGTELDIEITVEHRRKRAAARVVKKPFFDPERKKG